LTIRENQMYAIQLDASNGTINFRQVSSAEEAEEVYGNQVWMIVSKDKLLNLCAAIQAHFTQNSQSA